MRSVDVAKPRPDSIAVEANSEIHVHTHAAADALDQAHDAGRLAPGWHEINEADRTLRGLEVRLENERVAAVPATSRPHAPGRGNLPAALLLVSEQGREAGRRVEAWQAQPVDRLVVHERACLRVHQQRVVTDRQHSCHVPRAYAAGTGSASGRRSCSAASAPAATSSRAGRKRATSTAATAARAAATRRPVSIAWVKASPVVASRPEAASGGSGPAIALAAPTESSAPSCA